jgi:hypothetical protein
MKWFWVSGVCLSFGWFAGAASGQPPAWQPVAPRPLALGPGEAAPLPRPQGVTLGRPQPLEAGPPGDESAPVRRASFFRPPADSAAPGGPAADPLPLPTDLTAPPAEAAPRPRSGEGDQAAPGSTARPGQAGASAFAIAAGGSVKPSAFREPPAAQGPPVGAQLPRSGGDVFPDAVSSGEVPIEGFTEVEEGTWLRRGLFYGSVEYLNWWTKGQALPPLVTTSPATLPQDQQGVLGPNTTVLFGGNTLSALSQPGGRFTLGYWLGPCPCWAVEGSGFFLAERTRVFDANSNQFPVLGRPVQIANLGNMEGRELTATPGINLGDVVASRGSIHIDTPLNFSGAELNVRRRLCCNDCWSLDLLAGYRHLSLNEGLHIQEDSFVLIPPPPPPPIFPPVAIGPGDHAVVIDRFDTHNEFNGGQIGVSGEYRWGRLYVGGTAKVALGVVHQVIDINGSTTLISGATGAVTSVGAGILAGPSNSGHFTRDRFAVAPELTLKLGYQLSDNIRAFVAYDFLYLSRVVRPGDQVDRAVDANKVPFFTNFVLPNPPSPRPIVPFRTSDFWAQGVSVGLEVRY